MPRTVVSDLLNVREPLLGFNRSPAVVAAVTNAGGFGVLACAPWSPDELDAHLTWIDQQVDGRPYGIDVLLPHRPEALAPQSGPELRDALPAEHVQFVEDVLRKYDVPERAGVGRGPDHWAAHDSVGAMRAVEVALTHPISLVANGLGTPPPELVERAHARGVAVASLIGSLAHVESQRAAGVDLLVAQGTEAGGHTGNIATMVLVPEVVDAAAGIPVVAAGGIASGRQMAAALALGAAGVWAGSVWLGSTEEITSDVIKRKLLAASSRDAILSRARTGKQCRQLRSAWFDEWSAPDAPTPLPMPLQPILTDEAFARIDAAALEGNDGAIELSSWLVGQVVGSIRHLRGAREIALDIIDECNRTLASLGRLV